MSEVTDLSVPLSVAFAGDFAATAMPSSKSSACIAEGRALVTDGVKAACFTLQECDKSDPSLNVVSVDAGDLVSAARITLRDAEHLGPTCTATARISRGHQGVAWLSDGETLGQGDQVLHVRSSTGGSLFDYFDGLDWGDGMMFDIEEMASIVRLYQRCRVKAVRLSFDRIDGVGSLHAVSSTYLGNGSSQRVYCALAALAEPLPVGGDPSEPSPAPKAAGPTAKASKPKASKPVKARRKRRA